MSLRRAHFTHDLIFFIIANSTQLILELFNQQHILFIFQNPKFKQNLKRIEKKSNHLDYVRFSFLISFYFIYIHLYYDKSKRAKEKSFCKC
jgi:hypothetical protein